MKFFLVNRIMINGESTCYGYMPEDELKRLLTGCTYDNDLDIWISPDGISVYEFVEAT